MRAEAEKPAMGALLRGAIENLTASLSSTKARKEALWVVGHKAVEFILIFVAIKVFTSLMGVEMYGEYSLALTGAMLAAHMLVLPFHHTYLRYHHQAIEAGVGRSAGLSLIRWLAVVPLAVALLAFFFSRSMGTMLGLGEWTILATGLIFLGNRWRSLGVELLDIKRERRVCAIHNLSFLATQIALVSLALLCFHRSASTALFAYALAAAIFGVLGGFSLVRNTLRLAPGGVSDMASMTIRFGLPFGCLGVCQWVQNFSDRYVLAAYLDLKVVGVYVAAYQICGIPYMFLSSVLQALIVPIAYQRAADIQDPAELWSADKVLLIGAGVYSVIGLVCIPLYGLVGQPLLALLTSDDFAVSTTVLVLIALARYLQCLGFLLQPFFAVHQRMGASLGYRGVCGLISLPIYIFAVQRYGMTGAAMGIVISAGAYVVLAGLGPGGVLRLAFAARGAAVRYAAQRPPSETSSGS